VTPDMLFRLGSTTMNAVAQRASSSTSARAMSHQSY
jgi:hypothetical protein